MSVVVRGLGVKIRGSGTKNGEKKGNKTLDKVVERVDVFRDLTEKMNFFKLILS